MMAKCRSRVVFDFLFERLPIWALRFILFLVVVVAPFVHYGYVKTYLVDAQPLLLPGVLILGLALPLVTLMITRKYPAITGKFFVPLVLGGGVLLLCVQMFLVKGGLFETSWDVASVAIVHDRLNPDSLSYLQGYLSNNPNNTMINVIFFRSGYCGICSGYYHLYGACPWRVFVCNYLDRRVYICCSSCV